MMDSKNKEECLPSQGIRTLRDRHGGAIVPDRPGSLSYDGPTSGCTARPLAESAIAKAQAEENERAGLPVVSISPIGIEISREEEARREAAGLPSIPVSDAWRAQLPRSGSESSLKSDKPGPAWTKTGGTRSRSGSRTRSGLRSRSNSIASVSSAKSDTAIATERDRKARRELELNVRRCMENAAIARARSYEDMGESSDIESVDDEQEDEGSDTEVMVVQEAVDGDGKNISKRKRKHQRSRSLPDAKRDKRGRPPTTGEYVQLAEAKKALNEKKKIEAMLEWEKKINAMSPAELLTNMGLDLDEAVEDMKQNPTADVASRAREGIEVLKVARNSKNLNGLCVKDLKSAAVRV